MTSETVGKESMEKPYSNSKARSRKSLWLPRKAAKAKVTKNPQTAMTMTESREELSAFLGPGPNGTGEGNTTLRGSSTMSWLEGVSRGFGNMELNEEPQLLGRFAAAVMMGWQIFSRSNDLGGVFNLGPEAIGFYQISPTIPTGPPQPVNRVAPVLSVAPCIMPSNVTAVNQMQHVVAQPAVNGTAPAATTGQQQAYQPGGVGGIPTTAVSNQQNYNSACEYPQGVNNTFQRVNGAEQNCPSGKPYPKCECNSNCIRELRSPSEQERRICDPCDTGKCTCQGGCKDGECGTVLNSRE